MIKTITSRDNKYLRYVRKLGQRKYRDREGKYLIEGENLILEALSGAADIEKIIIRSGTAFEGSQAVLEHADISVSVPGELFYELTDTETSQGILAVVRKPAEPDFVPAGNVIVLDRLQDPGNIGTIIRTAASAGFTSAVSVKGTGDIFSPKTVRAAAGAIFRLPVITAGSDREMMAMMKDAGKCTVVTSVRDGIPHYKADLTGEVAVIIGNEGSGCSEYIMESADLKVNIPMKNDMESLNAAVAAGILMYETIRGQQS